MNVALWVLQVVLGIFFVVHGSGLDNALSPRRRPQAATLAPQDHIVANCAKGRGRVADSRTTSLVTDTA
jgi:hypothetical protein